MAKSKAKKHKTTHPTLEWNSNTGELNAVPEPKEYDLPYTDAKQKGKQFGMRITVNAFHQLLKGVLLAQEGQKNPGVRYVEFSKASLFRVLGQPGCEYIRFYFVYPQKGKMSLVMEGLDANGQALKLESHVMKMAVGSKVRAAEADDPVYEELAHGGEALSPVPATIALEKSKPGARKAATKTKNAAAAEQTALTALLKTINAKGIE